MLSASLSRWIGSTPSPRRNRRTDRRLGHLAPRANRFTTDLSHLLDEMQLFAGLFPNPGRNSNWVRRRDRPLFQSHPFLLDEDTCLPPGAAAFSQTPPLRARHSRQGGL